MGDDNEKTNYSLIPESIDNAAKNLTDETTKSIGGMFNDLFFSVFGSLTVSLRSRAVVHKKELTLIDKKAELDVETALEAYKKDLLQKVEAIPEEEKLAPSLSTVKALENSKYSFDIPELREMFANLVAKSMDARYEEHVNPAFAEILNQMSPIDANNMNFLKILSTPYESLPIVKIMANRQDGAQITLETNIFLGQRFILKFDKNHLDYLSKQRISISSLERLGLITINYDSWLADDSHYQKFEPVLDFYRSTKGTSDEFNGYNIEINKGLLRLTHFGKSFVEICCS